MKNKIIGRLVFTLQRNAILIETNLSSNNTEGLSFFYIMNDLIIEIIRQKDPIGYIEKLTKTSAMGNFKQAIDYIEKICNEIN